MINWVAENMARCKATEVVSRTDPPPSYAHCQLNPIVGDSSAVNAIPQTRVCGVADRLSGKTISCHCFSYCMGGAVAIFLCLFLAMAVFPYPLRASCTVKWKFREPCTFVMQRLRCQILKWTGCTDCGFRANRCLYTLEETQSHQRDNNTIRATHTNLQLVDDIVIDFNDAGNGSCYAKAKSVSRSWFIIFDYGMNYCNLRNLAKGAGFYADRGFVESTDNRVCTQLDTAVCA